MGRYPRPVGSAYHRGHIRGVSPEAAEGEARGLKEQIEADHTREDGGAKFPPETIFPWQGTFASRSQVFDYLDGDKIVCLVCGRWFRQLASHLAAKHASNAADYKDRYQIPHTAGLSGRDTKTVRSRKAREQFYERPNPAWAPAGTGGRSDVVARRRKRPLWVEKEHIERRLQNLETRLSDIRKTKP